MPAAWLIPLIIYAAGQAGSAAVAATSTSKGDKKLLEHAQGRLDSGDYGMSSHDAELYRQQTVAPVQRQQAKAQADLLNKVGMMTPGNVQLALANQASRQRAEVAQQGREQAATLVAKTRVEGRQALEDTIANTEATIAEKKAQRNREILAGLLGAAGTAGAGWMGKTESEAEVDAAADAQAESDVDALDLEYQNEFGTDTAVTYA